MIRHNGHSADEKPGSNDLVIKLCDGIQDDLGGGSLVFQSNGSMGMFGNFPPIMVCSDLTLITDFRIGEIANIVADGENHLVGYQFLLH